MERLDWPDHRRADPHALWRLARGPTAIHHATTGNLARRGIGDIPTLTVAEYRAKPLHGRVLYRLIRHPIVLFGIVPFYSFFLQNRIPAGLIRSGWRYWASALGTDAVILLLIGSLYLLGGIPVLLFVYLPMMLLAASTGMWLFYVQHQFEETSWDSETDWSVHRRRLPRVFPLCAAAGSEVDHREYRRAPCPSSGQPNSILPASRSPQKSCGARPGRAHHAPRQPWVRAPRALGRKPKTPRSFAEARQLPA
jgi:hypothetical protein